MANDEEVTPRPITMPPLARSASGEADSPNEYPRADTDRHTASISEAASNAGMALPDAGLAEAIMAGVNYAVEKVSNGNGNGHPPVKHAKKKSFAMMMIAVVLGGGATAVTGYYATEHRSKHNEEQVKKLVPQVDENTKAVEYIKVEVEGVKKSVIAIDKKQGEIKTGIEALREEARTDKEKRTEKELVETKAKLQQALKRERDR